MDVDTCLCAGCIDAQWCLPPRRQQAGSVESESTNTSGPISEKLKKVRSRIAQARCTDLSYSISAWRRRASPSDNPHPLADPAQNPHGTVELLARVRRSHYRAHAGFSL